MSLSDIVIIFVFYIHPWSFETLLERLITSSGKLTKLFILTPEKETRVIKGLLKKNIHMNINVELKRLQSDWIEVFSWLVHVA